MQTLITRMVDDFERGRLTRRDLIRHIAMLGAAATAVTPFAARAQDAPATRPGQPPSPKDEPAPTFTATGVDHIALSVTDVPRSRDFYIKHLGLTAQRDGGEGSCFLDCGNDFLALFRGREPGMHHYCYSVRDYTPDDAVKRLEAAGLEPDRRGGRVYFPDPDGLVVQVARGG